MDVVTKKAYSFLYFGSQSHLCGPSPTDFNIHQANGAADDDMTTSAA